MSLVAFARRARANPSPPSIRSRRPRRPAPSGDGRRLARLRREIERLDGLLLRLLGERLQRVRQAGRLKQRLGLPIRDYRLEAEVLRRYRAGAHPLGIEESLAEAFARRVIEASVFLQEPRPRAVRPSRREILIVGGAGKMGSWLADFLAAQGHAVSIHDPAGPLRGFPLEADLRRGLAGAEVVVLATPMAAGRSLYGEIVRQHPPGLLFDIFSLKSPILPLIRRAVRGGLRTASVHPLFGPDARTLAGRVVAVCDCGDRRAARDAEALFSGTALTITRIPVERHDELMQYVLGLSHLVSLLFFWTAVRSGKSFAELDALSSTTFQKQVRTAREVASESPLLYHEIQHLNRHSPALFRLLRRSLLEIERAALDPDPRAFVALMEGGRRYFPAEVREPF